MHGRFRNAIGGYILLHVQQVGKIVQGCQHDHHRRSVHISRRVCRTSSSSIGSGSRSTRQGDHKFFENLNTKTVQLFCFDETWSRLIRYSVFVMEQRHVENHAGRMALEYLEGRASGWSTSLQKEQTSITEKEFLLFHFALPHCLSQRNRGVKLNHFVRTVSRMIILVNEHVRRFVQGA